MSGHFPGANNLPQFKNNLFNKVDTLTQDTKCWGVSLPGVPKRCGKIKKTEKFDCGFFGIHHHQAETMNPLMRKSLETVIEAILDAGVNPSELRGSKTTVISVTATFDSEIFATSATLETQSGWFRSEIAHRVSYFLKIKGLSFGLVSDCSGSLLALDLANNSIRMGQCENAIVVSSNLVQHPETSRQIAQLGVLSPEGVCRVFDEGANGYARSEAVVCVFIQKAKHARRIYGKITHIKTACEGYKPEGIHVPSFQMQAQLIKATLSESGVDPSNIGYLEAHGTGTIVGDPQEAESIDLAVAKQRQNPLLLGAVKNNLGHTEASAGLCSLTKALIAMETGLIPPTINVKQVKKGIEGFAKNRLRVATEVEKLSDGAYIGINCFGWGGSIAHLLVEPFSQKKVDVGLGAGGFPKIVLVSGRSKEAVLDLLNEVAGQQDYDRVSLLQQIFKTDVNGHLYRGFTIFEESGAFETFVEFYNQEKKSLVVFFGSFKEGFQTVGNHLLRVPLFKSTTQRILKHFLKQIPNFNDDLVNLNRDSILTSFAVQLAVLEILKLLQLKLTPISNNLLHYLLVLYYYDKIDLEETITRAHKIVTTVDKHNTHKLRIVPFISKHSVVVNVSDKRLRNYNQDMVLATNFLQILGKLYQYGHNPQIHKLDPTMHLPVRRNTPMVSHLVKWNHDKTWYTYKFSNDVKNTTLQKVYNVSYDDNENLTGFQFDGLGTIPASKILSLVWQTFKPQFNSAVVFENCIFVETVSIPEKGKVEISVSILPGSGNFEVRKDNTVVASGRVFEPVSVKMYQTDIPSVSWCDENPKHILTQEEIYRELNLKGYNYSLFKGVEKCNLDVSRGFLRWENNWTTFLDTVLQIAFLHVNTNSLCLPLSIRRLTIDASSHANITNGRKLCQFYAHKNSKIIKSGAVEMFGFKTKDAISQCNQKPVVEKHVFVPNVIKLNLVQSLRVTIQIIVEKTLQYHIKALEIVDDCTKVSTDALLPLVHQILDELPLVTCDFTITSKNHLGEHSGITVENFDLTRSKNLLLVIASKIFRKPKFLNQILDALDYDSFILAREERNFVYEKIDSLEVLTEHVTPNEKLILLQKSKLFEIVEHVRISRKDLNWLPELQNALKDKASTIIYSDNMEPEGILGLTSCIRLESGAEKLRCFFMMDKAPEFAPQLPFYEEQLKKNFPINVFKNKKWGTYRYLPLIKQPTADTSRFLCEGKSYIILGGLGGFGLELANWLIENGATKIVLVSRVGVQTGYQERKIRMWKSSGATITVSTKDATTKKGCLDIIQEATELGPVDGIFNLSLVLKDGIFENQTTKKFQDTLAPKATVATYLDEVTRERCKFLRYFVMFSSMSCGRGNPGQSNYGMANSVMERICEKRVEDGLPGLTIQWGPIGDVGVFARSMVQKEKVLQGMIAQKLSSCLEVLDQCMNQMEPVVSSVVVAGKNTDNSRSKGVIDKLGYVLGIKNIRSLKVESTLAELGLDSMSGAQFGQILEREFAISMSLKEIRSLTLPKLIELEEEIRKTIT